MKLITLFDDNILIGKKLRIQLLGFCFGVLMIFLFLVACVIAIKYTSNFGIDYPFSVFFNSYLSLMTGCLFFCIILFAFLDKKVIINYKEKSLTFIYCFFNFRISGKMIPFSYILSIDLLDKSNERKDLIINSSNSFRKKINLRTFFTREMNSLDLNILIAGIQKCKIYFSQPIDSKMSNTDYYNAWFEEKKYFYKFVVFGYITILFLMGILILEFIYNVNFGHHIDFLIGIKYFLGILVIFSLVSLVAIFHEYIDVFQIESFNYYSRKEFFKDFLLNDYENPLYLPFQVISMFVVSQILVLFFLF